MLQQEQNKRNLNHLTDKEIKINYKTKKQKKEKQDGGLLSKNQKKSTGKKQTNKMADYFLKIHETCHGNDGTTLNV